MLKSMLVFMIPVPVVAIRNPAQYIESSESDNKSRGNGIDLSLDCIHAYMERIPNGEDIATKVCIYFLISNSFPASTLSNLLYDNVSGITFDILELSDKECTNNLSVLASTLFIALIIFEIFSWSDCKRQMQRQSAAGRSCCSLQSLRPDKRRQALLDSPAFPESVQGTAPPEASIPLFHS